MRVGLDYVLTRTIILGRLCRRLFELRRRGPDKRGRGATNWIEAIASHFTVEGPGVIMKLLVSAFVDGSAMEGKSGI